MTPEEEVRAINEALLAGTLGIAESGLAVPGERAPQPHACEVCLRNGATRWHRETRWLCEGCRAPRIPTINTRYYLFQNPGYNMDYLCRYLRSQISNVRGVDDVNNVSADYSDNNFSISIKVLYPYPEDQVLAACNRIIEEKIHSWADPFWQAGRNLAHVCEPTDADRCSQNGENPIVRGEEFTIHPDSWLPDTLYLHTCAAPTLDRAAALLGVPGRVETFPEDPVSRILFSQNISNQELNNFRSAWQETINAIGPRWQQFRINETRNIREGLEEMERRAAERIAHPLVFGQAGGVSGVRHSLINGVYTREVECHGLTQFVPPGRYIGDREHLVDVTMPPPRENRPTSVSRGCSVGSPAWFQHRISNIIGVDAVHVSYKAGHLLVRVRVDENADHLMIPTIKVFIQERNVAQSWSLEAIPYRDPKYPLLCEDPETGAMVPRRMSSPVITRMARQTITVV